jgi:uncharacterized protein
MKVLLLGGIKLDLGETEDFLLAKISSALQVKADDIQNIEIVRKSLDARRNKPPQFVYVLKIAFYKNINLQREFNKGIQLLKTENIQENQSVPSTSSLHLPVVIIGSGPAGLFASYFLAFNGIPSLILERGTPLEQRMKDVDTFWRTGFLNTRSNVFFGEGGAGTFSDGKLTARSKNPSQHWVKKILVDMGASPDILIDAKPHIGTDKLRQIIVRLRSKLINMGCRIEFNAQVTDFIIEHKKIKAIILNNQQEIKTNHLILAIGQSAEDTYAKLFERDVAMEAKPFAMGLRIEHSQELINSIQYGKWHHHPQLPPAEYFVKASLPELNRSVYTFCMCPGGSVIGCSAFPGTLITNGMSNAQRSGPYANSAVVVNVRVDDFAGTIDPLAGLAFRKIWEQKAFVQGGSNYCAPAQKTTDYLKNKISDKLSRTSFLPGLQSADLHQVLPEFAGIALKQGICEFDKNMSGFVSEESILIGVETRTSSPLRICRGKDGQSTSVRGIYPCGEGAGYAGGIISSAVDGIKAAQNLIDNLA